MISDMGVMSIFVMVSLIFRFIQGMGILLDAIHGSSFFGLYCVIFEFL